MDKLFETPESPELFEHKILPNLIVKILAKPPDSGQIATEVSQVIWPSAPDLAKFICSNSEILAGKNILELGSGTGLLGIAAYLCGNSNKIILTDYDLKAFLIIFYY